MPRIGYLAEGRTAGAGTETALFVTGRGWEPVRGALLEAPLKGMSEKYPLYEVAASAGTGAQQFPQKFS